MQRCELPARTSGLEDTMRSSRILSRIRACRRLGSAAPAPAQSASRPQQRWWLPAKHACCARYAAQGYECRCTGQKRMPEGLCMTACRRWTPDASCRLLSKVPQVSAPGMSNMHAPVLLQQGAALSLASKEACLRVGRHPWLPAQRLQPAPRPHPGQQPAWTGSRTLSAGWCLHPHPPLHSRLYL